ncbi:uncharacterized protein [Clytia hemisphaerica]|uniref:Uncharacterized protein n=1 Tax=Clytia hemisphaerica TaxID=252671 RepID=A0A7M5U3I6_9CNID
MADVEGETEYLELEEIDFDEDIPIIGDVIPQDEVDIDIVVDENELFELGDRDDDENIHFEIPTLVSVDEEGLEHVKVESFVDDTTKKYPQRKRNSKTKKENPATLSESSTIVEKTLICRICSKMYQRKYAFLKHQAICVMKELEAGDAVVNENAKHTVIKDQNAFEAAGIRLVKEALDDVKKDKDLQNVEPGKKASDLAAMILSVDENELDEISKYFCNKMYMYVKYHKQMKTDYLATKFHNMALDDGNDNPFYQLIEKFFPDIQPLTMCHTYQYFLKHFLQKTLAFCIKPNDEVVDVRKIAMTKDEESTLRYVAGYLIFSLKRKLKGKTSSQARAVTALIEQLASKNDDDLGDRISLNDFTCHWVEQINRGGLMKITDDFYSFVKLMENLARIVLNKKTLIRYCGDDIRKVVIERFSTNVMLREKWNALAIGLRNKDLSQKVLAAIFWKWANLRIHTFIKNWLEIRKNELFKKGEEVTEKAAPAMRKLLKAKRRLKAGTKAKPTQSLAKNSAAKLAAKKTVQKYKRTNAKKKK